MINVPEHITEKLGHWLWNFSFAMFTDFFVHVLISYAFEQWHFIEMHKQYLNLAKENYHNCSEQCFSWFLFVSIYSLCHNIYKQCDKKMSLLIHIFNSFSEEKNWGAVGTSKKRKISCHTGHNNCGIFPVPCSQVISPCLWNGIPRKLNLWTLYSLW